LGLIAWKYPGVMNDQNSQIQIIYGTVLLSVFLIPSLFYSKIKPYQAIKYALIWLGLGGSIFIGYAFRDEGLVVFKRLSGELIPSSAQSSGQTEVLRMGKDGHFNVDALVDGERIQFLIDTGASDVMLSPFDAKRLGFDLAKLKYSKRYNTANGIVNGAPINLSQISIGKINVNNISATVNGADMNKSLLGMGFLKRLSRFEIAGNNLILTP
jgi:aspartyl protease family protein